MVKDGSTKFIQIPSMDNISIATYMLVALTVWVVLLSVYIIKIIGHYKKLTKGENNLDLAKVLEKIVTRGDLQANQIAEILKEVDRSKKRELVNFQKHALIRFNPFEEAGGDQSFVVALLDGKNNGVVVSSLHSRNGTRVYAKQVIGAKALNHQFSKEETEAVEKAARPA